MTNREAWRSVGAGALGFLYAVALIALAFAMHGRLEHVLPFLSALCGFGLGVSLPFVALWLLLRALLDRTGDTP